MHLNNKYCSLLFMLLIVAYFDVPIYVNAWVFLQLIK